VESAADVNNTFHWRLHNGKPLAKIGARGECPDGIAGKHARAEVIAFTEGKPCNASRGTCGKSVAHDSGIP